MTSVVVVSCTSAIGMSLRLQGLVIEEWLYRVPGTGPAAVVDVALLDLTSNLVDARGCLAGLREVHPDLPLVVLGDVEACEALLPDEAELLLAKPPISAADVAVLLRTAVRGGHGTAGAPVGRAVLAVPVASCGQPEPPTDTLRSAAPEDVPVVLDLTPLVPEQAPVGPVQERPRARWRLARPGERRGPDGPGLAVEATTVAPPSADFFELVDAVEQRLPHVVAVTELSQVLLEGAVDDVQAEAGVVLLREDDGTWLVVAGVGLRPLEYRARLDDEHWVVRSAAQAGSALRVEDTDIARQRLVGLPLAGSRHLLVVGVGNRQALLVLGRGAPAFAEHDVQSVVSLCVEAGPHLSGALRLRLLARALAGYDELPPASR